MLMSSMTAAHTLAARSSSILTSSLPHPTQTYPTKCTREQGPEEGEDELEMEEEEVEWEEEERQSTKARSNQETIRREEEKEASK